MSPRSTPKAFLALLCAAALAIAGSGCGSSGGAPLVSAAPVAQAATATFSSGGSQLAMIVTVHVPGLATPLSVTGGGNFNMAHREGHLDFQLAGLPAAALPQVQGGNLTFTELFKGETIYMTSPLFEGKLPNGARWMKLDLAKFASGAGLDLSSLTGGQSNPVEFLQYLRGAGSIREAGHEAVRGTQTTRFDGTLDVKKALEEAPAGDRAALGKALEQLSSKNVGVGPIPFSVWIDSRHLVRRMKLGVTATIQGQSATAEVEVELFGFGPTQTVNPPAAGETFDATSQSLQSLSSTGG